MSRLEQAAKLILAPAITRNHASPQARVIREWGTEGSSAGQIKYAYRLTIGPEGCVWLSEFGNNRVQVFTLTGTYPYGFGSKGTGAGQFEGPRGVAFFGANAYVVDGGEASLKIPDLEVEPIGPQVGFEI